MLQIRDTIEILRLPRQVDELRRQMKPLAIVVNYRTQFLAKHSKHFKKHDFPIRAAGPTELY